MPDLSPRVAVNAPVQDPAQLAQTTALYGPQGAQLLQRSRMLAQAMADMRASSQNIRTPVALGSDLLAQALLSHGTQKTNTSLTNAYANQQQAAQNIERQQVGMPTVDAQPLPVGGGGIDYAGAIRSVFGGGGGSASSGPNAGSATPGSQGPGYAPEGQPGPLQVSNDPQGTPTPSTPSVRADGTPGSAPQPSSPTDTAALASALLQASGGGGKYASIGPVSPAAQQLAAALGGNSGAGAPGGASRASIPGPPPAPTPQNTSSSNFGDPHKDAGAYFSAALGGQPVTITSGLRTPQQNAAVGGSPTSSHLTGDAWDFTSPGMSSGQTVAALLKSGIPFDQIIDEGKNVHVGVDPRMRGQVLQGGNGHYQLISQQPQGGAPSPVPNSPQAQGAPAQPPAPTAAPTAPQPPAGTGAPGGQGQMWRIVDQPPAGGQWNIRNGVAYGLPASDAEKQQLAALWANQLTKPQGDTLAQQIVLRQRTPITYKQEISRDGQILMTPEIPGTGPTMLGEAPGYTLPAESRITRQQDNTYAPTTGATYGPAGERPGMTGQYQTGPSGRNEKVGEPPFGSPQTVAGGQGQYQQGPNGRLEQTVAPIMSTTDLLSARNTTRGSETVAPYYNTVSALGSMKQMIDAATQPNGVISMEIIDRLTNMGAGGVATPAKVNLMLEHLGFPQEVAGHLTSLIGQGPITPETIRQLYGAGVAYATTQQKLAQQRVDEDTAYVKQRTGQDLGITLPQLPSAPTAGWFNGGQGAPPAPQPQAAPPPTPSLAAPQQPARTPASLASPPPATLANARAAIQKGADRAKVSARLQAAGYDPRGL